MASCIPSCLGKLDWTAMCNRFSCQRLAWKWKIKQSAVLLDGVSQKLVVKLLIHWKWLKCLLLTWRNVRKDGNPEKLIFQTKLSVQVDIRQRKASVRYVYIFLHIHTHLTKNNIWYPVLNTEKTKSGHFLLAGRLWWSSSVRTGGHWHCVFQHGKKLRLPKRAQHLYGYIKISALDP